MISLGVWWPAKEGELNQVRGIIDRSLQSMISIVQSDHHLLGPFNIENKVIVSESWHSCDGSGCILSSVETDEGKTLQRAKWEGNLSTSDRNRFSAAGCSWNTMRENIPLPVPDLRLSGVLVFGQVDPGDGAKWSEKFLQVSLAGVLRQVGHTNSSVVVSCGARSKQEVQYSWIASSGAAAERDELNAPLRLGCMDSPRRVPPSLRLGGTYFPVLLWAGCAGSGSASKKGKTVALKTMLPRRVGALRLNATRLILDYLNLQACPCLRWKVPAAQPAPSAWDPECPCTDSEWSSGLLCKYDRTRSSVLSACSWDPRPGLEHLGPILEKMKYATTQVSGNTFRSTSMPKCLDFFLPLCWKWRSWRRHRWLWW